MEIGAVIVTYNPHPGELKILLESIYSSVKTIVIVDNGSNNIVAILKLGKLYVNSTVLQLNENKGIGFAQNKGIEQVFFDKAIDAVILFDHDSHPDPDMIFQLQNDYEKLTTANEKVGAVGPVFLDPRTQNQYPIPVFSGFSLLKVYPKQGDISPVKTSFLIASGCLIPRKTIETIGVMREGFFIDYIDIEWSFRATANNFKLFTCPAAKMKHKVGDERIKVLGREISVHSPLRRYYLARNSVLMLKISYINWRYKFREVFYTFSRVIVYLALVNNKRRYLRYILNGWYDGLQGREGICKLNNNT